MAQEHNILAWWRQRRVEAMLKGEKLDSNPPIAENEVQNLVLKVMTLVKVATTVFRHEAEQTAEEREHERMRAILDNMPASGLVRLIDIQNKQQDDWAELS